MPSTKSTLHHHVLRAHYQAMIWKRAHEPNPILPKSKNYGWTILDNRYSPIISLNAVSPNSIIKLVIMRLQNWSLHNLFVYMQEKEPAMY